MSLNYNQATIVGRLVRDPEMKALPSGQNVTSLSIATNHIYTNKTTNEKKESVEYHNVIVFGRQAENANQFLKKGDEALVSGRIQTRQWETEGVKHYKTEIIADSVMFGAKAPKPTAGNTSVPYPVEGEDAPRPEDIPF